MLVLSRRPGETIVIGNDTSLTVDAVHGLDYTISLRSPGQSFKRKIMRCGDSIRIADEIAVFLSGARNERAVKIAVQAPRSIPVNRLELWRRKQDTLKERDKLAVSA